MARSIHETWRMLLHHEYLSPRVQAMALAALTGIGWLVVYSGIYGFAMRSFIDGLLCPRHDHFEFKSLHGRHIATQDIALCGGAAGTVGRTLTLRRVADPAWVEPTRLFAYGS